MTFSIPMRDLKPLTAGPSSPPPSRVSSFHHIRRHTDKGKGKAVARKLWADGPWPLIETPSRTQPITHPALHIANELSHTHNAMLRGLNALYLQAPFVSLDADVADFLFLIQIWSGWVLDHHSLKENAMMPGFEAALRLEPGSLGRALKGLVFGDERGRDRMEEEDGQEKRGTRDLSALLHSVHSYATETHPQPSTYSPSILQPLLASLASVLVPHLHAQIPLLMQIKDLCSPSPPPLPLPPPPPPPSSSSSSSTRSSTSSAPRPSKASDRATHLTQIFHGAESSFSAKTDRYTIAPMLIRLRDVAHDGSNSGLSVPAVHAIADRLSPRHAGAWRFLPCDVWGRRRELEFLGGE
ncbi:hypothetical protein F5Y13DRAFT_128301 [Hypoxylon sp. FL1857]|nr:hypothetical protein F5Y13DRAFT_128301 [Hypoxylon sp. FL1857]